MLRGAAHSVRLLNLLAGEQGVTAERALGEALW